ncbi:hypothetical protein GII36_05225 [Candidatus Mycosynbacter amalyticus]|uniref:HTH marR-type domain-containing protein n=1 Tax=Candidatus Mycosynbacter amalyticus TaxID=2665156 RepID=A0A857MQ81_9BACT|nr:hypothetical protein [Candidatus Mycosynbacter amalyticus]QHN43221.1 hypothetical protein GII36_05225 [Candidatus Mycosynbacter amalyticus]
MNEDISQITTYESGIMQSAAHRILGRIESEYLAQYNLTSMQWFAVGIVRDAGERGIGLSDLMRTLDTTMPYITTLVATLEAKGILHKISDTSDSRVKLAVLNPKYRKTVDKIELGLRDELRLKLYREDHITREELSSYIAVLYKIVQASKL